MSESFADLLDASISSLEMQTGSIVSGVVLDIDKNWVTVHVGLKSEGVISIDEFRMLLRRSLLVLITIFVFFSHANALVFERRPRPDPELSYFL